MQTPPARPLFPGSVAAMSRFERSVATVLAVLFVLRCVVAVTAPVSPDEAYYWLWTRPLQLSYFDHPGMVAWWMWCGVHVFGDTATGVRVTALLSTIITTALVWDTGRIVWASREAGARAALWLNAMLLFGAAGILMTPDAPLALFWSAAVWALVRLDREGHPSWLYVAGLAVGLGADSKYTIGLLIAGALAAIVLFPNLRRWMASIHFWLALILAAACATPVILWNSRNDWASVAKQFGHAFASGIDQPLLNMLTFIGGQLGLATPLICVFVVAATAWMLVEGWRRNRADWFLIGAASLPIIVFFALHALDNVVQAHWPGPAYLAGAVAAGGLPFKAPRWRAWAAAAPILGLVLTALVYLQTATAILPIEPRIDPTKRLGGWTELAQAVEAARHDHPDAFLFVQKHEVAGLLSFYLPDHPIVFQMGNGMRPPTYPALAVAALKDRNAIFVTGERDMDAHYLAPNFVRLTPIGEVTLHWGGRIADRYRLTYAEGYKGGLFVEGDGYPGTMDKP
jgi:hypothetical protein